MEPSSNNVGTTSNPQSNNLPPQVSGVDPSTQIIGGETAPPTPPPHATKQDRIVSNSTQNALSIAEIRDGIVIMNDGTFRSVVMVKAINFDLMSPQEREYVEFSYQGFLNSLFFPIQIYIHSERVDIKPYIDRLDKIRQEQDNMLLALLTDDYINFMISLAQQTNIMDKNFYIIIPFSPVGDIQQALTQSKSFFSGLVELFNPKERRVTVNEADLNKAKDELRNRVQSILSGLEQCNIKGLPLDTQELIELYYNTYNPDTAVRQKLKDFDELTAPIVTKGQGMAPQPNLDKEILN